MLRFLCGLVFYIVVGRFFYGEIRLMAPSALPSVHKFFNTVRIPTHDQWNGEYFSEAYGWLNPERLLHQAQTSLYHVRTLRDDSDERKSES